jgi:TrmH family RNA methyltransferase
MARSALIASRANPLIKQARALRQPRARAASGLFVVEGIHPVGEAMAAGWEIESILYDPAKLRSEFAREILSRFKGRVEQVATPAFDSIAGKDNPQGILAIVRQRIRQLVDIAFGGHAAALVAPQDPGNVGTILRTLDALQGDALFVLDGGVDPFHPTAVRASMGASFWVPIVQSRFDDFTTWRRDRGDQLIASSARGGVDPRALTPTRPWILLLGSEQRGLTAEQRAACDIVLSLPMQGRSTSLNLAVAAGILLYGLAGGSALT